MNVSKNSYYYWVKYSGAKKVKNSKVIQQEKIKAIFDESNQVYGST